jgi:vacuolar-type H+-ATPase subunit I/STV1
MSNSKKEVREGRGRNYSFSSNHNEHFDSAELDRLRDPLRETDIIRNYSPSRFEAESLMRTAAANPPLEPISPSLIVHQEDEIRKLEEVIYYLTGDRDILKEECASLHMELGVITVSFGKEKEAFEADIRKLREIIKDKESECLSLAKNLRKEKEIFEQEHERLNYQLKSTIEKKTDEIYTISREK